MSGAESWDNNEQDHISDGNGDTYQIGQGSILPVECHFEKLYVEQTNSGSLNLEVVPNAQGRGCKVVAGESFDQLESDPRQQPDHGIS